jgi:hypothetical protein
VTRATGTPQPGHGAEEQRHPVLCGQFEADPVLPAPRPWIVKNPVRCTAAMSVTTPVHFEDHRVLRRHCPHRAGLKPCPAWRFLVAATVIVLAVSFDVAALDFTPRCGSGSE